MDSKVFYELGFIVYHGISKKLDEAITKPQEADIQLLEGLVDYYRDNYILSCKYLDEKLQMVKSKLPK